MAKSKTTVAIGEHSARQIANLSVEDVWRLPDGPMVLVFDDGTRVETTSRHTIVSWYVWEFHREYPKTPLLPRHHLKGFLKSRTHLDLLGKAQFDCIHAYPEFTVTDISRLNKLDYVITNQLYIVLKGLERYVTSISARSFVELMDHPAIAEANANVKPNTIDSVYTTIKRVIYEDSSVASNPVVRAARQGVVSIGQVLQCIGPRGNATDIDSRVFPQPILTGFVEGMRNLEDQMKESRSASKALMFSKKPMQDSEYMNRSLQLSAQPLMNLHPGDCGSTQLIPFQVRPGDIDSLLGIWYEKEKGKLECITEAHHYLVGKTIYIRNVFHCLHPDPVGICSKCFGEIWLSVPELTNIGHFSSTELQAEVGQRLLSTKHEDTSADVEEIVLTQYDLPYIGKGNSSNTLMFNPNMVGKDFLLIIPEEAAQCLHDVSYVDDIHTLVPTRITEIAEIQLIIRGGRTETDVNLNVSCGTRRSSFTHAMLEYIKKIGWSKTETGDYVIEMKEWTNREPFLELPMKHYSMVEFQKALESFIKGSASKTEKEFVKSLASYGDNVAGGLAAFHDLVSSKIPGLSLSHLQVVALSTMVESVERRDFWIPRAGSVGVFNTHRSNMTNRSLSAMMAYQDQAPTMLSLKAYLIKDRPPHPLDPVLIP